MSDDCLFYSEKNVLYEYFLISKEKKDIYTLSRDLNLLEMKSIDDNKFALLVKKEDKSIEICIINSSTEKLDWITNDGKSKSDIDIFIDGDI